MRRSASSGRPTIADLQRRRLIGAMLDARAEHGAGGVTTQRVIERAGVSRWIFYQLFENSEDCLLAAFDETVAVATLQVQDACSGERSWSARIRAGLAALLRLCDQRPEIGSLLIVESLAAGPAVLRRRAQALTRIAKAVDEGGAASGSSATLSPLTAEAAVGAVLFALHSRISRSDAAPLSSLLNELTSIVVLPYLGSAAAAKELRRPLAVAASRQESGSDALRRLNMRLTHRTTRVLLAVGAQPGASNRDVGATAGVIDQGQISKLLSRLQGAGLIRNKGARRAAGSPNAWALTPLGVEVRDAILAHTRSGGV